MESQGRPVVGKRVETKVGGGVFGILKPRIFSRSCHDIKISLLFLSGLQVSPIHSTGPVQNPLNQKNHKKKQYDDLTTDK